MTASLGEPTSGRAGHGFGIDELAMEARLGIITPINPMWR